MLVKGTDRRMVHKTFDYEKVKKEVLKKILASHHHRRKFFFGLAPNPSQFSCLGRC